MGDLREAIVALLAQVGDSLPHAKQEIADVWAALDAPQAEAAPKAGAGAVVDVRVERGGLGGPDAIWLYIGHQGFRLSCEPEHGYPGRVDWYETQLRAAIATLRAALNEPRGVPAGEAFRIGVACGKALGELACCDVPGANILDGRCCNCGGEMRPGRPAPQGGGEAWARSPAFFGVVFAARVAADGQSLTMAGRVKALADLDALERQRPVPSPAMAVVEAAVAYKHARAAMRDAICADKNTPDDAVLRLIEAKYAAYETMFDAVDAYLAAQEPPRA